MKNGFSADFLATEIEIDVMRDNVASEQKVARLTSHIQNNSHDDEQFAQETIDQGLQISLEQVISVEAIQGELRRLGIREETVPYLTEYTPTPPPELISLT